MVTNDLRKLQRAREKLAALEAKVQAGLRDELSALPKRYGYESAADLIRAIREAAGTRRGSKASRAPGRSRKRRRARITDATRAEVKRLVGAGKTGAEIARATGISLPSVQNIKKAFGLTKARK